MGIKQSAYYSKPSKMLNAQRKAHDAFNGVFGIYPDFGTVTEVSALGAEVVFPMDGPPFVKEPLVKNREDADKLEVPNPYEDCLMCKAIEYYEYMRERVGDKISIGFYGTLGPFDMACLVRGATSFMKDLYRNKELAHKILKITTQTCIKWLKVQEEVAGKPPRVKVADDYPGFISPTMFKEFVMPYTKQVFASLSSSVVKWWHSDGDMVGSIVELLPEMGVQVFYRFHPSLDLREAMKKVDNKICLTGNVSPDLVLHGSPEEIKYACKLNIEKGVQCQGYILAPGGEIVRGTPPENIRALIEASKMYGRYKWKNINI